MSSGEVVVMREMRHVSDMEEVDIESQEPVRQKNSCCASCWGWIWKDWTQVVGRVGLVTGIPTTGVGGYLLSTTSPAGPYVIGAGIVILVVTYFFPDCAVSRYKPEKALEDRVKDFQKENRKLTKQIADLSGEIEELNGIKEDLEAALGEAEASIEELRSSLAEKVGELGEVVKQLQATEEKLGILEKLYKQFKAGTKQFASDVSKFNRVNKVYKATTSHLNDGVSGLDSVEDELSEEIGQFEDVSVFFEQQNKQLSLMLQGLNANIGSLQGRFSELKEALIELRKHTVKLDEVDDKFETGATKLEGLAPRLEAMLLRFNDLIEGGGVNDTESSFIGGTELYEDLSGAEGKKKAASSSGGLTLVIHDPTPSDEEGSVEDGSEEKKKSSTDEGF